MLWFALACAPAPDPCAAMCDGAASLYGGCLGEWGADWPAAGYADEADFLDACATWAFQMRALEVDAGRTGDVDAECAAREATFAADDATCEDYTTLDWNSPPWQEGS